LPTFAKNAMLHLIGSEEEVLAGLDIVVREEKKNPLNWQI
jgi:hypothetical protein